MPTPLPLSAPNETPSAPASSLKLIHAAPRTISSLKCRIRDQSVGTFSDLPMLATVSSHCSFDAEIFDRVMTNLIRNPNITSSHLFRADVFWDSANDASYDPNAYSPWVQTDLRVGPAQNEAHELSSFIKHMKSELKPRGFGIEGFELRRTMVRQMVPRNTKLDKPLAQTCHFLRRKRQRSASSIGATSKDDHVLGSGTIEDASACTSLDEDDEDNVVVYIPHISTEEEIPWYHPKVKALCFLYTSGVSKTDCETSGATLSIHISPFPVNGLSQGEDNNSTTSKSNPANRLNRTLQNLLSTIHRHGTGQAAGYQKRVHHDRLIPQARLQDTYTRLKNTYAKDLLSKYWQEQTDATKGIFEDLGIAAFCIELWKTMYRTPETSNVDGGNGQEKPAFPGFVDIGCGNGVLTFILLSEGWPGWGFDARSRKTWDAFPSDVGANLKELVLVPSIFTDNESPPPEAPAEVVSVPAPISTPRGIVPTHNGLFPHGTFIISNHADELTVWAPLLGHLNNSPFVCIPCCSHDLSGSRFRFAPPKTPPQNQQEEDEASECATKGTSQILTSNGETTDTKATPDATKPKSANYPSAYSTLCSHVSYLADCLRYTLEEEILRIPSTRNVAIVGRKWLDPALEDPDYDREETVRLIVGRELGRSVTEVGREWRERAAKIAGAKGGKDSGKH